MSDVVVLVTPTTAAPNGLPTSLTAITEPDGRYQVKGLPAGEYTISASPGSFRAGHRGASYGVSAAGNAAPMTLAVGEHRTGIDIKLPRAFAVEGVVSNESGERLSEIDVSIQRLDGSFTRSPITTDDRGMFRLYGLPPGAYRVCAEPSGQRLPAETVSRSEEKYVRSCTPVTTDLGEASAIIVRNEDVEAPPIILQRSGTGRISGQVVDSTGALVIGATVVVKRASDDHLVIQTTSTAAGFAANGLAAGDYRVRAHLFRDDGQLIGETTLRVSGVDVSGVTIPVQAGVRVAGQVLAEGTSVLPDALKGQLRLSLRPPIGQTSVGPFSEPVSLGRDGRFELPPAFEPLLVRVAGLPPEWVVQSIVFDGQDITDRPTHFTATDTTGLRITLARGAATLTVHVTDDQGQPTLRTVVVMPADEKRRLGGLRMTGRSVGYGRYEFNNLAPGEYLVNSWPTDSSLPFFRRDLDPEAITHGAVRVTLVPGANRIDLRSAVAKEPE